MEELLIIGLCMILNGLLAAFEMAFVSVSRGELKHAAKKGSVSAKWVLARRESPERTLSVIQIGITFVGAIAAAVGGVGAAESVQPYFMKVWGMRELSAEILSVILIVLPLTYLIVVLGELTPKALALRAPLAIAMIGARWVAIADKILSPVVSILEWSTKTVLKVFFFWQRQPAKYPPTSTVEIDSLEPDHQEAVVNFAHIEGRRVNEILIPWKDVTFIRVDQSPGDIVPIVFASGHTRLPVTDDESVIGILHTKEFLALRESGVHKWQDSIRPAVKVSTNTHLLSALRLMQQKRSHLAVVLSSESKPQGIVTMEDIIEEFLGDILDEDDHSRIRKIFASRVKAKGLSSRDRLN